MSFNRYMVECESERYFKRLDFTNSFNRYMVECEFQKIFNFICEKIVLIDTWWNVNIKRCRLYR